MNEIQEIKQALQHNLELVRLLSRRIEILEQPRQQEAGRMIATMTVLRAVIQCSPSQKDIATMTDRIVGQMQAQPGYVLNWDMEEMRKEIKQQLTWFLSPPAALE